MRFSIQDFFIKCDQIPNGRLHFLCRLRIIYETRTYINSYTGNSLRHDWFMIISLWMDYFVQVKQLIIYFFCLTLKKLSLLFLTLTASTINKRFSGHCGKIFATIWTLGSNVNTCPSYEFVLCPFLTYTCMTKIFLLSAFLRNEWNHSILEDWAKIHIILSAKFPWFCLTHFEAHVNMWLIINTYIFFGHVSGHTWHCSMFLLGDLWNFFKWYFSFLPLL